MKFLVSIPKERVSDGKWTTRREPVVPCFPSQHSAAFLTIPGFLLADRAEVAETQADADDLANALVKEYPGLPTILKENYVLAVWKAVIDIPLGTVFTVAVNQKQAMLVNEATRESVQLWDEQPLKATSVIGQDK